MGGKVRMMEWMCTGNTCATWNQVRFDLAALEPNNLQTISNCYLQKVVRPLRLKRYPADFRQRRISTTQHYLIVLPQYNKFQISLQGWSS